MECKLSSELGHRLSDLLIGASYRDLKILSNLLQNCNILLNPEKLILFHIGQNEWNSLLSYGIPALEKILSLFPDPHQYENEITSYYQDVNELLESIESFEPNQLKNTIKSCPEDTKDLVLRHLSKLLINGSYKKNKVVSEVLQFYNYKVGEDSKFWYNIGLGNWEELRKFGYEPISALFEYLKEAENQDIIEIIEGILQLNELFVKDGLYHLLLEDKPLIDSIKDDEKILSHLLPLDKRYAGTDISRTIIRLLSLRSFLADENQSSILRDYADILIPWLHLEIENAHSIQEIDNIFKIFEVISIKEIQKTLIEFNSIIVKLTCENKTEAEKILIPYYLKIFDILINEEDWLKISQFSLNLSANRELFDVIRILNRKQSLYYWIGIKSWRSAELFTDIELLAAPSLFHWLPNEFPKQSASNLISLANIYQKGNSSIPYTHDWYELYQWLQIGIALSKREHFPIDQFGSPIIPKIISTFITGNEKEQEFLFLQLLRFDSSSIEKALVLSEKSNVDYIKHWAINRLEEFSFSALQTFLKSFHVEYSDIALYSPCIQMLFAIGNSANHLIKEPMSLCERRLDLILNILPTTSGEIAAFLFDILIEQNDHEKIAKLCLKIFEQYIPPKYCTFGESEKLIGSQYLQNIFSEKNSSNQLLDILSIIHQYQPGGIKNLSAVNFNIVTQWLGKQLIPRSKSELDTINTLWDFYIGFENNEWTEEQFGCYYICHSNWEKLKELNDVGINALLDIFVLTKGFERSFIVDALKDLEKESILNCIDSIFKSQRGITLLTEITCISNPNDVSSIFLQIFDPEYVHVLPSFEKYITSIHRKEFGIWLNHLLITDLPLFDLNTIIYYLDYIEWKVLGIEARSIYNHLKKNWSQILDSLIIPEKIGNTPLHYYLCNEIIQANSENIELIANILLLSNYNPDKSICGVFYTIGLGNWMDIPKFGEHAIFPLLSLLSSTDPVHIKRAIYHLDIDIGREKICNYVENQKSDKPWLIAPIVSDIRISHPEAIRFCINLYSNKDGGAHVIPNSEAYTQWLRDFILPYIDWDDLIFALKILDTNDISIIEGNAFESIIKLWSIVESLSEDALPLYLRLLFSHNSFLIDWSIDKLTKIGIERVTSYLLVNPHSTDKIFSEYETPDKRAIQYILKLLSQDELRPIIPQKKICSWFRRTLPYFAWCDLYKAASLIEKFCIPDPFLRNKYYISGKRQWEDIKSLFSDEPEKLVEYLSQAPEPDQAKLIKILGEIGNPKSADNIKRCLESPYSNIVRVAAIGALTNLTIKLDNHEKLKFLFKRFEMLADSDPLIIDEIIRTLKLESNDDIINCIITILEKDSEKSNLLMTSIMGTEKNPNAVQYIIDLFADQNLPRCEGLFNLLRNRSETLLKFWLNQLKRRYPLFIRKIITIESRLNIGCQENRS